jgi:hypothetical protein
MTIVAALGIYCETEIPRAFSAKSNVVQYLYILLSQAELAPTRIMLIDTCNVGATFGCEQGS